MRKKFTQQDIQQTIYLYNSGKQQHEIAKQLNCSQVSISNILKKNNVNTRVGKKITYNDINYSFFKKIDSEESAYFLGLLYSDGCVQIKNSTYVMSLKLKSNDQIILEKFRDILSPSSPIKISEGKYSYFRIHQKEICQQLISHGCVPNKSLILQFPTTVPKELWSHFIRGYSDGDGTIYRNNFKGKTYANYVWKIISTNQFCNSIADILKNELNINCSQSLSIPKTNQITTTLSVGGNNQSMKFLNWLYKNSTVYLPRKYNKYLEFKNYFSSSKSISGSCSDTSIVSSTTSKSKRSSE